MCLTVIIGDKAIVENDENHQIVTAITEKLEKIQRKDANVFLQVLYGHTDTRRSWTASWRPSTTTSSAHCARSNVYLEMFLARREVHKEHMFSAVKSLRILDLLRQNEYQLLALHIVNKSLEHVSSAEAQQLLDCLCELTSSSRSDVRNLLYAAVIFIAEKFRGDATFNRKVVLRIILKGFTDGDQLIQNRVAKFFDSDQELPKTFTERFMSLLANYYDPSLEKEFLHYATQLLLEVTIKHPRSTQTVLDYDKRRDADFFEYPVSTRSSTQKTFPPMFLHSQQRQLLAGDGSQYQQLWRQTQADSHKKFTPTQDPTEMSQVPQTFAFKQTQDALFFSLKPQYLDKRSQFCSTQLEDDTQKQIDRKKESQRPDALDYLRRRIVREAGGTSKEYAIKAIERREFTEAQRQEKVR